jgi:ABC-type uncharacterized transport system ATPase subunit
MRSERSIGAKAAPLLSLKGIGKLFGAFEALAGIDIDFHPFEVHCLLGENGAGKSTLCNLIFGINRPSAGEMILEGRPYLPSRPRDALTSGIAMVHQHFSLVNELSVIDNLLLGRGFGRLDRKGESERLEAMSRRFGLEISPAAIVGDLSVGQRQRVEIVKCLMSSPRVLVLDEPTAVLLPDEISALLGICRQVAESGCAVVMVTHKLAEIERVADRVTVLHRGRIAARSDRPGSEISRLVGAMIHRPDIDPDAVIGARAVASRKPKTPVRPTREAMQIDGITVVDRLGVKRLDDITLTVGCGEVVGIAGVEGNGQSELGAVLAGLLKPSQGRWFAGNRELTRATPRQITGAGVGIVPEDRHAVGAISRMSLADNMFLNRMHQFSRFRMIDRRAQRKEAEQAMARFDVRAAGPLVPFGSLSGGNQQKAVLGRELTTQNLNFLLAAQPTRGLDVGAIEAVYGLVRDAADAGVGVLLISSELDELISVADRILVFYRGRIVGEHVARPENGHAIGALMSGQAA